jgi:hypothetical protein
MIQEVGVKLHSAIQGYYIAASTTWAPGTQNLDL